MPSFDRPLDTAIEPSTWILRFAALIRPGGRVLDVAAGHGRHTGALRALGFSVVAADLDVTGLADFSADPGVIIKAVDLEAGAWPFTAGAFDGIVVANYLHRPQFAHYVESLAPEGVLIIDTFGAGNEKLGRPRNPEFLLKPGELYDAFARDLHVAAYEHGAETMPRPAVRQRLCAVKAPPPILLP
jgi:SAM-dependent methyltransferase